MGQRSRARQGGTPVRNCDDRVGNPGPGGGPLSYTNRLGETYYLHQGTTRTGKPRFYVARSVGPGALAAMPEGFEFTESLNGVVSVRRVDTATRVIPEADIEAVRQEMSRHTHLRRYVVEERKGEIVIHEPVGRLSNESLEGWGQMLGTSPAAFASRLAGIQARARYAPVMKFAPAGFGPPGDYTVYRMTYRGEGGWRPLSSGRLGQLVTDYIRHIGTDEFFELL